ncbi:MAG: hypothetical protein MMC23_007492 [Stictis urceolatum]|nr:hypothetical protein [Stictis urceolata]
MKLSKPLLLLAIALPQTLAWGSLAHRTVAYLATHSFNPTTKVFISTILANDRGWDISDAALWPDKGIRWRRPETKQWHFIDARDDPPNTCGVQFKRDCTHDGTPGCVVSAIKNMSNTILDPHSTSTQLREATMFVMHFLGDIHQPLHTEYLDRGGNDISVCFDAACGRSHHVNLHSVWDSFIPLKWRNMIHSRVEIVDWDAENVSVVDEGVEKDAAKYWAEELYNTTIASSEGWVGENECTDIKTPIQCSLKWANESNKWICDYVLRPGKEWLMDNDLGDEYYAGAVPVVEDMVTKAGMRLGAWMNGLVEERMRRVGSLVAEDVRDTAEVNQWKELEL